MTVQLLQLDGKLPNIALMRIAAHHRALGDDVSLTRTGHPEQLELFVKPDRTYASLIFERTRPVAERLLSVCPNAIVGGTGWDVASALETHGITTLKQDYADYPWFDASIGFTQRGCRLACKFCVVPRKEGKIRFEQTIADIWRGHPYPKHIHLLDNDFFGQEHWRERVAEIIEGGYKVSFNQGINVRFITEETAASIATIPYYDDSFTTRRLYTAWDNRKDEERLFRGLNWLQDAGVKPDHLMVYMLIGFWPGETEEDWLYRAARLRDWGARPYPMPYVRTPATVGFQRWIVGAYDKRIKWSDWVSAGYEPRRLAATDRGLGL